MIQLLQTAMPPSNLAYLIAAFAVTGVIFVGYVFYVFRRRQETQAEIRRLLRTSEGDSSAGRETT